VVSPALFIFSGAVFALGFVALAAWKFLPATTFGKYGGWIALAGISGSLAAFLIKTLKEASAHDRFDACHNDIETVFNELEDAEEEQARLDKALSLKGGSVVLRLQHAERHLAELERILPVESQHREVAQAMTSADRRLKLA